MGTHLSLDGRLRSMRFITIFSVLTASVISLVAVDITGLAVLNPPASSNLSISLEWTNPTPGIDTVEFSTNLVDWQTATVLSPTLRDVVSWSALYPTSNPSLFFRVQHYTNDTFVRSSDEPDDTSVLWSFPGTGHLKRTSISLSDTDQDGAFDTLTKEELVFDSATTEHFTVQTVASDTPSGRRVTTYIPSFFSISNTVQFTSLATNSWGTTNDFISRSSLSNYAALTLPSTVGFENDLLVLDFPKTSATNAVQMSGAGEFQIVDPDPKWGLPKGPPYCSWNCRVARGKFSECPNTPGCISVTWSPILVVCSSLPEPMQPTDLTYFIRWQRLNSLKIAIDKVYEKPLGNPATCSYLITGLRDSYYRVRLFATYKMFGGGCTVVVDLGENPEIRPYARRKKALTELQIEVGDLSQGFLAYYPLDGDAADLSGNGQTGEISGPTSVQNRFAIPNAALHFDGVDDFVNCGDVLNALRAFTIAAWVKVDGNAAIDWNGFISEGSTGCAAGDWMFYLRGNEGGFGTSSTWLSGDIIDTRDYFDIPVGSWHHVAQTFDGRSVYQYVDGEYVNTTYVPRSGDGIGNASPLILGRTPHSCDAAETFYFQGDIDELRIYGRALTAAEIQYLHTLPN